MDKLYIKDIMSRNRKRLTWYSEYSNWRCEMSDLLGYKEFKRLYFSSNTFHSKEICDKYGDGCRYSSESCGNIVDTINKWFMNNRDRIQYG